MKELDFVIGKRKVHSYVPESWVELSERQFWAVVCRSFDAIDDATFYSQYFGIAEDVVEEMDLYYFYVLNSLLSFTRERGKASSFIVHRLKLRDKKKNEILVEAPQAKLSGMSFQQFMTIDTYYTWYLQTKNKQYLLQMCSCCYLQPEEDFFQLDPDERVEYWNGCDEMKLNAVMLQWTLIKEWLSSAYSYLFPQGEAVANGKDGKVQVSNAWIEIFDTLVADDLTRVETYKRLECMEVIRIVNYKIRENKKQAR